MDRIYSPQAKDWFWAIASPALLCVLATSALLAEAQIPVSVYDQATVAFQQGQMDEAERVLRSALRDHPRDAQALGLLGVILDAQKRYEEAETCYSQSLKLAPKSAALQNNLGNHYLARGMPDRARTTFLRVVAIDPGHPNANLQLAQMSVSRKEGKEALQYLNRLPDTEQASLTVQLLRARSLYSSGQRVAAEQIVTQIGKQATGDPRPAFSLGMVFVEWERFAEAERAFNRALEAAPANFDILYNLGLAATRAGHLDRAQEVFEVALRQRPEDVDCLYGLARVQAQQGKNYLATGLLVKAQRLAPKRPDVLLFLAHTSEQLGFFGDSASAYDQYLKLRPDDDMARRERGFALSRSGKMKDGLQDLEWYTQKHPKEADGLYKLAIAEMLGDREKALKHLTQALESAPDQLPIRYARALLQYQEGKPAQSIEDLKVVLQHEPDHVRALDLLGQSLLLLDQPQEAAKPLSRAVELAPRDPTLLIHYSRVLRRLGRKVDAEMMLARFKEVATEEGRQRPHTGLFDYLNLSPAEKRAHYLDHLQKRLTANPEDTGLRVQWGKAMLEEGKIAEALETFHQVQKLTQDGNLLAECGKALLEYEQYEAAKPFLEAAAGSASSPAEVRLDLALAVFHAKGPKEGLASLDQMPAEQRKGDYYLLRAQMLDALGQFQEAAETLNRGFRAAPTRPDLYFQASLFLIKHNKYEEAQQLLRQALRIVPDTPELMFTQAILFELLKQPEDAKKLLTRMQSRWPEWEMPYLIHGIILEIHLFSEEAKSMLETAIALGANDPAAYYFLALATMHASPDDTENARKVISQALRLSPEDPYILSLAGKNALSRKDYAAAIEHLAAAVRYKPDLVEARYALSAAYRATGNQERFAAELKEAQRLEKESPQADSADAPVRQLLFTVRAPGRPSP
jgi:tetratricopeptide (TPR) repeat protein